MRCIYSMTINARITVLSLLTLTAFAVAYAPTLASLHHWWSDSALGYSHGYPVLLISLYVIYERRRLMQASIQGASALAMIALAGGSLLWLAAEVVQVQVGQQLVLVSLVFVWAVAVMGLSMIRHLLPVYLLVLLAVPIWDFLIDPLRIITVVVVQNSLEILQIPALIDGFFITLPVGRFVVEGGCSGLNYMLTSLTLGLVYSMLYLNRMRRKLAFIAICIVVALLVNWARVFLLVVIGYYTDMQAEMVHDHETFGWVLYAIALLPLFWMAGRLERGDAPAPEAPQTAFNSNVLGTGAWLLATALLFVGPGINWLLNSKATEEPLVLDVSSPQDWQQRRGIEVWVPEYSGFDRVETLAIRKGAATAQLAILYYDRQTQGKELVYYDNRLAKEEFVQPLGLQTVWLSGQEYSFNEAVVEAGGQHRLVWSTYWVAGQPVAQGGQAKIRQLQGLVQGELSAALVTFSSRCRSEYDCESARQELSTLVQGYLGRWLGGS